MAGLTAYQKRLFAFLGVATFFEGYDFLALSQILPNLRKDFGLDHVEAGLMIGLVNAGTVIAYLLVHRADRWGRRRVLMITIAGYTLFTFLSGFAPDVVTLTAAQFLARIFLIGEWAVSMVYAAEEFPAEKRGMVIGVIQAFSSLGAIVCAGVTPLLLSTDYGWRSVYFVGIVPLLIMAFARRTLRETERFERVERSTTNIWRTPYRRRVIQLGFIWMATYACSQTAITFWKEFVLAERGFTDAEAGGSITIAAVVSMPLIFLAGKLLDAIGRRRGAVIIFLATSAGVLGAYTLEARWALTASLAIGIFGVSAVLPVLNAYTSELFPTEHRASGFAWANNVIGRLAYVTAPIFVGLAAESVGWGLSTATTAIFPIIALISILWLLPETRLEELEVTSKVA